MNKYELTTLKKKTAIIDAALFLFVHKGFSDVSIKEIAAKANVSQVSLYNYFGSKEALVAQCAKVVMDDTINKATEILEMEIPFADKLIKSLSVCTESANVAISKRFSEAALSDPALMNLLKENINKIKVDIYRDYIALGKKEKVISDNLDAEMILAFLDALNTMEYKDEGEIEQIHHLFLYGIIGTTGNN